MKTFSAKPLEVKRDWFVVDASDKVLGRLASEIALRLRGKHKPEFTPHVDTGDFIVVINADKLVLSAEKAGKKTYYRHTGYPGGIIETTFAQMQEKHPGRALEIAVKGMLPKGPRLRNDQEAQDLRRRRTSAYGSSSPRFLTSNKV